MIPPALRHFCTTSPDLKGCLRQDVVVPASSTTISGWRSFYSKAVRSRVATVGPDSYKASTARPDRRINHLQDLFAL